MDNTSIKYEKDFYAWALYNAELIRQGKISQIDFENIAEEIESMGKSDRRELVNRFAVLLSHLLKWKHQPERRGNSWKYTIKTQRLEVNELLLDSPSLKYELKSQFDYAYEKALLIVIKETGLSLTSFNKLCPFSLDESLSPDFFPSSVVEEVFE